MKMITHTKRKPSPNFKYFLVIAIDFFIKDTVFTIAEACHAEERGIFGDYSHLVFASDKTPRTTERQEKACPAEARGIFGDYSHLVFASDKTPRASEGQKD
jgi:hypothetical protein